MAEMLVKKYHENHFSPGAICSGRKVTWYQREAIKYSYYVHCLLTEVLH